MPVNHKPIENQQSTNISSKEMKFDGREIDRVGTEMTRDTSEID